MSILVQKSGSLLLCPILGHYSVHKSKKSYFLGWMHIEYFHLGIFVIPRACLIRKYGSQEPGHFFLYFNTSRGTVSNASLDT